jgi:hypothetical protein
MEKFDDGRAKAGEIIPTEFVVALANEEDNKENRSAVASKR